MSEPHLEYTSRRPAPDYDKGMTSDDTSSDQGPPDSLLTGLALIPMVMVLAFFGVPTLSKDRATPNNAALDSLIQNVALSLTLAEQQHPAVTVTGCSSVSIPGLWWTNRNDTYLTFTLTQPGTKPFTVRGLHADAPLNGRSTAPEHTRLLAGRPMRLSSYMQVSCDGERLHHRINLRTEDASATVQQVGRAEFRLIR